MKKKPWLAPKNGPQIAALETARHTQRVYLKNVAAGLARALATLRQKLPRELDHELAPLIASQKIAQGSLIAAEKVLEGYQKAVVGTFAASRWIVANGLGKAFDLNAMQIETRVSTSRSSYFATDFTGRFLGKPFATRLKLDLKSPARMAKDIASALVHKKAPKRSFRGVAVDRLPGGAISPPKSLPKVPVTSMLSAAK